MIFLEILVGLLIIVVLVMGIYMIKFGFEEDEPLMYVFGIIMCLIVIVPVGFVAYDSYQTTNCTVETTDVIMTVIDKDHEAAYSSVIMVGKTPVVQYHDEEFNVEFDADTVRDTIDNKNLYEALKIGDKIQGQKENYVKPNGEIYKQKLRIK